MPQHPPMPQDLIRLNADLIKKYIAVFFSFFSKVLLNLRYKKVAIENRKCTTAKGLFGKNGTVPVDDRIRSENSCKKKAS